MSLTFLLCANVVLLARLVLFFRDDPPTGRAWALKTLFELGVLVAAFDLSLWLGVAGLLTVVINLYGRWREAGPGPRNLARLGQGAVHLLGLSVCCAPQVGLQFRPEWAQFGRFLAEHSALAPLFLAVTVRYFQVVVFALLISANEANLVIRAVFEQLDLKPRLPSSAGGNLVDVGEFNRGRIIGVLERLLLCFFVLHGQFGAIGFILAAKAFTRFKALDDRPFAEYVLIGTLLSACLAVGVGILVRAF